MSQHLTIAYLTMRKEPRIEWFLDSLRRELSEDYSNTKLIVVSYLYWREGIWNHRRPLGEHLGYTGSRIITAPKPCVWQGMGRLTKTDWFAASNARNTALCLAPDGWIAYVDDLSVLMPGWLKAVREAMAGHYIVLGAYKKVKKLCVENGEVKSFEEFQAGIDSRWPCGSDTGPVPASGGMMYGCSVAMPVESLLTIGGWPEYCDGLGSEDYVCGLALQNNGYEFRYDRRMLTLESEEDHHNGPVFRKEDWHFENGVPVTGGNGRDDKSHAALNIALGSKYFDNYYEGGMRKMREEVLSGKPFPVVGNPQHDWFTKVPLSEL